MLNLVEKDAVARPAQTPFEVDAANVLGALRIAITNVLSSLGGIRKATDLQRQLKLEWTLSWQLSQLANTTADGSATLATGAKVPSRSALKRFLDAAATQGVDVDKIARVWSAFERFERLVDLHAGDRSTFISMVSAAAGMNSEWLAADLQHRRNAFRAMSHAAGVQATAKHKCAIYRTSPAGDAWELCVIAGYVGLRYLRPSPNAVVFRMRDDATELTAACREPLGSDSTSAGAYLLPEFSTNPLPLLRTYESESGWLVTELEQPAVGKLGASTLRIGTAYRNYPAPKLTDREFRSHIRVDKPVEVLISDVLLEPGIMRGVIPTAGVLIGNGPGNTPPGDALAVLGEHRVEFLGKGPAVLATPDVPDYTDLMHAAARKFGCDVDNFEAWRLRLEFPFYQSDVRITWQFRNG